MVAQRQSTHSAERPAKKTAAIWSPATDIENNNNHRTSCSNDRDAAAADWKLDHDQTKMRYMVIGQLSLLPATGG